MYYIVCRMLFTVYGVTFFNVVLFLQPYLYVSILSVHIVVVRLDVPSLGLRRCEETGWESGALDSRLYSTVLLSSLRRCYCG